MGDLKQVVEENFTRYAGNVILDRAICDVRDMLKPAARMLTYSQYHITKNLASKPFVKSARVVGDCLGHYYTHGDASCYGTYMRMAKPFAMRYPLEDCQGNSGTINSTGDEAASRYTELRLSKLGNSLFDGIEKNTIDIWSDNFDETDTYPSVLCSKGYYNICNGTTGIGVSLSSSIPQFNIKDINNALIELINNPNYEVDILPDFATGAILTNPSAVREALTIGSGAACRLRSIVEYDNKERCFVVNELPYGVYCDTISEQIQKLVEENETCGIDHINNGSGKTPDYRIYISKGANPDKVLKLLYKETSLESYFTINMTVLTDKGRKPKVLSLKEMLLQHIEHEKLIYRKEFEFNLDKISKRLHIIEGLLKCCANIEDVVRTIKSSANTSAASKLLCEKFLLDEIQAKAVLDMKLSRLAHLEVEKLENEKLTLEKEYDIINNILSNEKLFNEQLINGWKETIKKFGDARRTKIMDLSLEDGEETIEKKQFSLLFTNHGATYVTETSTLYTQKRKGVGSKFKLDKGEYVIDSLMCENTDTLLFFSKGGQFYTYKATELIVGDKQYLSVTNNEIVAAAVLDKSKPYIIFVTKNGIIKKSKISDYNLKRNMGGSNAIKLDADDKIVSICFVENENIGIMSKNGYFILLDSKKINPIGRVTRGVIGMGLNSDDYVIAAVAVKEDDKEIIIATNDGLCKRTLLNEFKVTGRGTKGVCVQKNGVADFYITSSTNDISIISNTSQICLKYKDIPLLSRSAQGVAAIKLTPKSEIIKILQI